VSHVRRGSEVRCSKDTHISRGRVRPTISFCGINRILISTSWRVTRTRLSLLLLLLPSTTNQSMVNARFLVRGEHEYSPELENTDSEKFCEGRCWPADVVSHTESQTRGSG
jgi:hypothetical protein